MSKLYTLTVSSMNYDNKITFAFTEREERGKALRVLADAFGFTLTGANQPLKEALSFSTDERDTESVKCNVCGTFLAPSSMTAKGAKIKFLTVPSYRQDKEPLEVVGPVCLPCMKDATASLTIQRRDHSDLYTDLIATGDSEDSQLISRVDKQIAEYGEEL